MEVNVRKAAILIIMVSLVGAIFVGCDQQKALDQILQKPEMKTYLMTQMMKDEGVKAEITTQILTDSAWVANIVAEYSKTMANREIMLNAMLEYPGMGQIMLSKMSEDPELKAAMKEIGNRRR